MPLKIEQPDHFYPADYSNWTGLIVGIFGDSGSDRISVPEIYFVRGVFQGFPMIEIGGLRNLED